MSFHRVDPDARLKFGELNLESCLSSLDVNVAQLPVFLSQLPGWYLRLPTVNGLQEGIVDEHILGLQKECDKYVIMIRDKQFTAT